MAGLVSHTQGRGFWRGFGGGVLGGSLGYVGRRMAASGFTGAGLVGYHLSSVGASVTRTAAFGEGLLDTLVLSTGPLRSYLVLGDLSQSKLRVDATSAAWLLYAVAHPRYRFEAGRSFSAGVPVFSSPTLGRRGFTGDGVIVFRQDEEPRIERTLAHESVHAAQRVFLQTAVGLPYEAWIGRTIRLPIPAWGKRVDVGLGHYFVWPLLFPALEREARILAPG